MNGSAIEESEGSMLEGVTWLCSRSFRVQLGYARFVLPGTADVFRLRRSDVSVPYVSSSQFVVHAL